MDNNNPDIVSERNFDLSKHTTYRLGGKCKIAFMPGTEDTAIKIFYALSSRNERFFVLGNGSDILASDKFYNGSVICTSDLKKITLDGDILNCQSGVTVAQLLKFCIENGLSGLEFLAGIPASVGGLTYMNAGACGKFISDVLVDCKVFNGELHIFSNKLCDFGYKYSTMRDINCLILSSRLKVKLSSKAKVKDNIRQTLLKRIAQPKGRSCGCVFKNPNGLSAGKIIEECGLKGFRIGGAVVSRAHANFILNEGATAAEIYALIGFIKARVFERFGLRLEEEVVYIGEFNDTFG